MDRAVFFDTDGTIAWYVHYCRRVEDFELLPNVPQAIKLLNENGWKVVVVTDQSGVAQGHFTGETPEQIHPKMKDELAKHNARVDAIYYYTHHPDEGCDCRKQKTALFLKAAKELDIDLSRSYVVGDMQMDIEAARALRCKTILVSNDPHPTIPNPQPSDHVADNLLRAAERIVSDVSAKVTIMLPAYNEEHLIGLVIQEIMVLQTSCSIIVGDNNSSDQTVRIVKSYNIKPHSIIQKGKGNVIRTLIAEVGTPYVIMVDSDYTYPLAGNIEKIVNMLEDGVDVVIGFRKWKEPMAMSPLNQIGNRILSLWASLLYGRWVNDVCSGLWGFNTDTLKRFSLTSEAFTLEAELFSNAIKQKAIIRQFPIRYRARLDGSHSKLRISDGFKIAFSLLRHRM